MRDQSIVMYDQFQFESCNKLSLFRQDNMREQTKVKYQGIMSDGARKRMTKAIILLCESSQEKKVYNEFTGKNFKHRMSFITLTVSNSTKNLTGKEAYNLLLQHFLQWMRRTKKATTYIWKAELQKRGQIHYHITTPTFISYLALRLKWNELQQKAGLLDKYFEEHNHYNPNSTDIHEVRKIRDMAGYLCKEITKSVQNNESIGGKVWDCSTNLKVNKYFSLVSESMHDEFLYMAVENEACELFQGDHFSIYKFKEKPHKYILSDQQLKKYDEHLHKIRRDTNTPIL